MAKQSMPETNVDKGEQELRPRSPDARTPEVRGRNDQMPPEGPHAREDLIDRSKTPGAGALTERRVDGDADASTG